MTNLEHVEHPAGRPPMVSVGLPVYNGERYLRQALESLLAQDYRDFELIVSDNGSTDGTETICREFAARDRRIRYHREPVNRGAAWNFNRVARLARGRYFRWACHDDACEPSHLRRCVEVLEAAPPSVVLVYTRTLLVDEDGAPLGAREEHLDTRGMPAHRRFRRMAERLRYSNVLYGLLRRDALMRTRLLGPYESSDYVLLAELALLGEFAEVPEPLFRRRVHDGMSLRANRTQRAVARWFDPASDRRFYFPQSNLLRQHAHAVLRAPVSGREKALAALALRFWARRAARLLLRELVAPVLPRFRVYG